jgi:hypothetical protein
LIKQVQDQLLDPQKLDARISAFIAVNDLPPGYPVSLAVDAMALTPNRSCLPSERPEYSFVMNGQPLDRQYKYLPLHPIKGDSGQATPEGQAIVSAVCERLERRGIVTKYVCTDGHPGYSELHHTFFNE